MNVDTIETPGTRIDTTLPKNDLFSDVGFAFTILGSFFGVFLIICCCVFACIPACAYKSQNGHNSSEKNNKETSDHHQNVTYPAVTTDYPMSDKSNKYPEYKPGNNDTYQDQATPMNYPSSQPQYYTQEYQSQPVYPPQPIYPQQPIYYHIPTSYQQPQTQPQYYSQPIYPPQTVYTQQPYYTQPYY